MLVFVSNLQRALAHRMWEKPHQRWLFIPFPFPMETILVVTVLLLEGSSTTACWFWVPYPPSPALPSSALPGVPGAPMAV